MDTQHAYTPDEVENFEAVFGLYDHTKENVISKEDCVKLVISLKEKYINVKNQLEQIMSEMEIGSQLSFDEFLGLMNKLETRLSVQDNVGKLSGEKSWSPRKGKSEASQRVKKD